MITFAQLAPAIRELVDLMNGGAAPRDVAAFVLTHKYHVALSHTIEDHAAPGTFAEKVFNILCGDDA